MTVIPTAWRYKLAAIYLTEVITVILGTVGAVFGASIVAAPKDYARIPSFAQAFAFVAPPWWGLTMVILGVLMVALLVHSRAAAAVPAFLLGIVWVLWVLPIAFSANFAPSAPIVYTALALLTLVAGMSCLVERGEADGRT
ncbi:hypothetical protein QE418_000589 [Microbacterium testaceum]|uniref:hypothetical protein n=1 Tax=Microbacterium TaxID=33882 RepID=UPI0027830CD5|nr:MULTISPECIES: hypothetical protein [Microbacterium]MDQ1111141.1 hypothetical protein [Microbacterium testaceum]MDR6098320.1 hypothetical protein [Microbacterium sp. SORGH_AS_0454]